MRLIDLYAYVKRSRHGQHMILRCGRRFLDIAFARHLPWEQEIPRLLLAKWTKDGFKWSFDVPGFHLRVSYHRTTTRPFRKDKKRETV